MIDSILFILVAILVIFILYKLFTYETPSEKEYNRRLKESLEDEFIIDPETGVKLTLEEAESGNWSIDINSDEFSVMSYDELKKIPTEESRTAQIAINYIRNSRFFRQYELTEEEFKTLEKTRILSGYDDWSYSHPFKFNKGILILPVGELNNTHYRESYIMVWMKISDIKGHYLFKEKTSVERFFDLIRNDDDIELKDYECLTLKKSNNVKYIKSIVEKIVNHKGLEIEVHNDNLFLQTLRLVNIDDIKKIELIINKITFL